MARIDNRTRGFRLDYSKKDINEAYRAICANFNQDIAEAMAITNRHSKELTIHSLMSLANHFKLKFEVDFAEEKISIMYHENGKLPIEITEGRVAPQKKEEESEVVNNETEGNDFESVNAVIPNEDDDPF